MLISVASEAREDSGIRSAYVEDLFPFEVIDKPATLSIKLPLTTQPVPPDRIISRGTHSAFNLILINRVRPVYKLTLRREEASKGYRAYIKFKHAPAGQALFYRGEHLPKQFPKAYPDRASDVLAKPCRACRLPVPPYAAKPAFFLKIMWATQGLALPENLCAAVLIKQRESWRASESKRGNPYSRIYSRLNRSQAFGRRGVVIIKNPTYQIIKQLRQVGATFCAGVETRFKAGADFVLLGQHGAIITGRSGFFGNWSCEDLFYPPGVKGWQCRSW